MLSWLKGKLEIYIKGNLFQKLKIKRTISWRGVNKKLWNVKKRVILWKKQSEKGEYNVSW